MVGRRGGALRRFEPDGTEMVRAKVLNCSWALILLQEGFSPEGRLYSSWDSLALHDEFIESETLIPRVQGFNRRYAWTCVSSG